MDKVLQIVDLIMLPKEMGEEASGIIHQEKITLNPEDDRPWKISGRNKKHSFILKWQHYTLLIY